MNDRRWTTATILSVALFFFTVPHVLEDFALGEPVKRGIPMPAIAFAVSCLLAIQGLGLVWLGQRKVIGLRVHAALGLVWAAAAGFAQVPEMLADGVYRSGPVSAAYVVGVIATGLALCVTSVAAVFGRPASAR